MSPAAERLARLDRVVADPLRFKQRLRIGEDAYALRRLVKHAVRWWESASAAGTGAAVAKSAAVATALFAPPAQTGLIAWLGLAAPAAAVTPAGWAIAAAVLAGGGYYGVTRWWASRPDNAVDVIPRFINSPIDALGASVFDLAGGLALRIAAADGVISPAERAHILDHLVTDWGFDPTFAEQGLALLEEEVDAAGVEAVANAMARFVRANRDCNAPAMRVELMAFLQELIAADGRIDPAEQAMLQKIDAAFADKGGWSIAALRIGARNAAEATSATAGQAAGFVREKASDLLNRLTSAQRE